MTVTIDCTNIWLTKGASGGEVSNIQTRLQLNGYYLGYAVDGNFGSVTYSAVKKFQTDFGLTVDGIVGPKTCAVLNANPEEDETALYCTNIWLKKGDSGDNVTTLQTILSALGYYTSTIDGDFGSVTYAAVKSFQTDYNLTVDGIVGPITCAKLNEVIGEEPDPEPETGVKIGYFINPNDNSTPLVGYDFSEEAEKGMTICAGGLFTTATKSGVATIRATAKAKGITFLSWIWYGSTYQKEYEKKYLLSEADFDKLTKQFKEHLKTVAKFASSNYGDVIVDFEKYNNLQYLDEIKALQKSVGDNLFCLCMKPDGWDGTQNYDTYINYCDYIIPMAYTGDYGASLSTLTAFAKKYGELYPGKFGIALETYESDSNVVAKSKADLQAEIDAVSPYVDIILLFRKPLDNYGDDDGTSIITLDYVKDVQNNVYQCGPSSWKMGCSVFDVTIDEDWLAKQIGTTSTNGTKVEETDSNGNIIGGMTYAPAVINPKYGTNFSTWCETFDSWTKLRTYLKNGYPVILRVKSWLTSGEHYVLLYGLDIANNKAYMGDPSNNGYRTTDLDDLRERIREVSDPSIIPIKG